MQSSDDDGDKRHGMNPIKDLEPFPAYDADGGEGNHEHDECRNSSTEDKRSTVSTHCGFVVGVDFIGVVRRVIYREEGLLVGWPCLPVPGPVDV